jgi:hypothetical protein
MNTAGERSPRCTVQGGELLPLASGGADALCAEIEAATADLSKPITVSVRVLKPQLLAATVTVEGRILPEMKMARADRPLDRSAFERFAKSIAAAAAGPPQP